MAERDREEESQGFKIIDRRAFTPEGQRRAEVEPPPSKPAEKQTAAAAPARPAPPPPRPEPAVREHDEPHEHPPAPGSFEELVMSLATTAMYQLGLVKSHEEDEPRADLPSAKATIDLLEMLQEKTKGNLTQDEHDLLENSLFELHMIFVELSKPRRSR